jgi:branched-chain amino acid aminotransferase
MTIAVHPIATDAPRRHLPEGKLGFGTIFTEYMLNRVWGGAAGPGWHEPRIEPRGPIAMDPAASVLHYGQTIFEGMKAFRGSDDRIRLFRPERNAARFATSAERVCLPALPAEDFVQGIKELVLLEKSWVPSTPGASLYIRPTMIATEGFLGVRPASEVLYYVIMCPVDAYYATGFAPVKIWVESNHVRAAKGGLGAAKAGANYVASLYAAEAAKKKGFAQVLWTDASHHEMIEEVGTMNLFVQIGDEVITPSLDGSILPGVTRESVIHLLTTRGMRVVERPISLTELKAAHTAGTLREVFGTGTAAVISPVGLLAGETLGELVIGDGGTGPLAQSLFDEITQIQRGERPDPFGWVHILD